ncbi:hypothetical protein [Dyella solisilvae]|uniref:hypothetical protein n=1 Tax=Dyella solisilvae TaxID=1920168 RepID=UPI0018F6C165|nr:hypothetical protein [Dyella solisilvae]
MRDCAIARLRDFAMPDGRLSVPLIHRRGDSMEAAHAKYQRLIERCQSLPPTPTAVAHPCDESSLMGAMEAARLGLISPTLVGPLERIRAVAASTGADLSRVATCWPAPDIGNALSARSPVAVQAAP